MMKRELFEDTLLHAVDYWSDKDKQEVQNLLGKEAAEMVNFQQRNPHHCYDLFEHILHTVDEIPKEAAALMKVAAFFHDIGKIECAKEKEGRLVFYGHAKRSAEIAGKLLRNMGYPDHECKEVCFYIEHHDDFIQWQLPEEMNQMENSYALEISEQTLHRYLKKLTQKAEAAGILKPVHEILDHLLMLCYADSSAQAEEVWMNGKLKDSRRHKQEKIKRIQSVKNALR